jgi:hypothetical protein
MVERQMTDPRIVIAVAVAIWSAVIGSCQTAFAIDNPTGLEATDDELSIVKAIPRAMPVQSTTDEGTSAGRPMKGNPLWGIPIDTLHATRERPLFSPSRRPPAPVVTRAPVTPVKTTVPVAAVEPSLSLLGIVAGDGEGFAVFINTTTHDIIRLKTGEGEDGWILRSVKGREAVLENNQHTKVLELPPITGVSK